MLKTVLQYFAQGTQMHALVEILDDCERVLSSPEQIEALATALQRRHNELELARGPYDLLQQVRK